MIFFNGHESKASLIQRGLRATVEAILFFPESILHRRLAQWAFFFISWAVLTMECKLLA